MQVTSVTQRDLSHALDGSFEPNWIPGYPQSTHEVALFELDTDTEHTGYAASPSFAGGLRYDGPLSLFLTGMDPHDVDAVRRKLASVDLIGPRPWHLLMACWDLIGKAAGKPVYELLGGTGDAIPAYASAGAVGDVDDRLAWTEARVDDGFSAVKLRISSPEDVAIVDAVRESFPDLEIMVDANKGWAVRVMRDEERWSPKTALSVARDLEALDVRWLEEPLPRHDHEAYAELRRRTDVPIAGGEFLDAVSECYDLLDAGGVDVLQPDAAIEAPVPADLADAPYVGPVVFQGVDDDDRVAREEVFGPVLSVFEFESRDEVVARANDTAFGLAAGVWTSDLERAHAVAADLDAGTVWVNTYNDLFDPAPHGGYKASGIGRELSKEAMDAYRQAKTVKVSLGSIPNLG